MHQIMTPQEAEAVLRLQLERGGDPSTIRVDDVAEALRLPSSEVERLLAEVRAAEVRKMQSNMAHYRARDMRRLAFALLAALLVIIGGLVGLMAMSSPHPAPAPMPSGLDADEFGFAPHERATPNGPLPQIRVGAGDGSMLFTTQGQSVEALAKSIDAYVMEYHPEISRSEADDAKTIEALKKGRFDDPALGKIPIHAFYGQERIDYSAWLYIYDGTNPEAKRLARQARIATLMKMLRP